MPTFDELNNRKPIVDKIGDFFSGNVRTICILLGLVCSVVGFFLFHGFNFQVLLFIIALIFFVVNLYLVWLSKREGNIPSFVGLSHWTLTFVLVILAIISCFADEKHNVVLPIAIIALCLINQCVSGTYREKWDMPNALFKKLITVEKLGVIIAVLQLVIAYPQLQQAFKSVSRDDFAELNKELKSFHSHVDNFIVADIPDSLMNEDVVRARTFQKQILANSLLVTNFKNVNDVSIDPINSDRVAEAVRSSGIKINGKLRKKKNLKLLTNFANAQRSLDKMRFSCKRAIANNLAVESLFDNIKEISSYYLATKDSSLFSCFIDLGKFETVQSISTKQPELLKSTADQLLKAEGLLFNNSLDIHVRYKKYTKLNGKWIKPYNEYLSLEKDRLEQIDDISLDFMEFLNIIQLKYAYDVGLKFDYPY